MDWHLVAALAVAAFSGVVFGLTGFGFALVSVPPLLLLYEPATVVTVTIGVSLATSVVLATTARQHTDLRLTALMLPGACAGLVAGAWVLTSVNADVLKGVAGGIIVAYSLLLLANVRPRGGQSSGAAVIAGIASGTLATSTGLSGPPIVMLFTAREVAKDAFRGTMATYFVVLNAAGLVVLIARHAISTSQLVTTAALIPAGFAGALLGNRIARRVTPSQFRVLTVSLLILTGTAGVVTALVGVM